MVMRGVLLSPTYSQELFSTDSHLYRTLEHLTSEGIFINEETEAFEKNVKYGRKE